ncbi:hypothetical protein [Terrabacter sp. C0L_2]|uniref:hypothetical protein n=1 Tax=Terrabacter sp. C0L_2 TaxID=3108389 RepID=UPI002ED53F70|nr:hypothetical protein U5C87_17900 [Terrabacter sp. C0L_2]
MTARDGRRDRGRTMTEPVFFSYDPRTVAEQEAAEAAKYERFARDGGVVADVEGNIIATLTPVDPPSSAPNLRLLVGPPPDAPIVTT